MAKLTDLDERRMQVYEIEKERWTFKLAPQSSGRAQQAYVIMGAHESSNYYEKLKDAILKSYDITDENYLQRFRSARVKHGKTN